jgi:hypothetical protein
MVTALVLGVIVLGWLSLPVIWFVFFHGKKEGD